jgi:cellulose synthase/poly-beta-1,6-N-acetylglucosamine synthase-like glycosyltransferase
VERLGGWDEHCLTEDADIGLRLSALGEPIRVFYDAHLVTREETPDSVTGFIKQRTRWHQGFLQLLRKGDWRRLPKLHQRLFALYTFSFPWVQSFICFFGLFSLLLGFVMKIPVAIAITSYLPLYVFALQAIFTLGGAFLFAREYRLRLPITAMAFACLTYIPYQFLHVISSLRALYREIAGMGNWEKTAHSGAHR